MNTLENTMTLEEWNESVLEEERQTEAAIEAMDYKPKGSISDHLAAQLSLDCIVQEIKGLIWELYFAASGGDESIELPGFDHIELQKELSNILNYMDNDILAQIAKGKGQKFLSHLKTIAEAEPAEQNDIAN